MWDLSIVDGPIPIFRSVGGAIGSAPLGSMPVGGSYNVPVPGYHLNVGSDHVPFAAAAYRVHPSTPTRVFAGDEPPWSLTTFLRFESEWQARALLPELWHDPFAAYEGGQRADLASLIGSESEVQFRKQVLARLDQLQAVIASIPSVPGVGHNSPPEPMADEALSMVGKASAAIRLELEQAEPDVSSVVTSAKTLDAVGAAIQRVRDEAAKLTHVGLEKGREYLVVTGAVWLATHGPALMQAISNVLNAIATWLPIVMG